MSKHNNFFPCRWTTRNFERISRIRIHTHFHDSRRIETTRRGSWKGRRRRGGSSALSTGPAYWSPVRRGHTPFAGSRLFMARDSCGSTASQPASQPPRKRVEEEGGIMEVRARIVRDQKVEVLRGVVRERDPFIMEMSRNATKIEKMGGEGEDFFFVVLIWSHGDEWRKNNTNRDIEFAVFIVKRGERTLFPVYFYTLWRMN